MGRAIASIGEGFFGHDSGRIRLDDLNYVGTESNIEYYSHIYQMKIIIIVPILKILV